MSLENPNFIERRPTWQKVLAIALLIIGSYALVFWLGTWKAREWAASEYLAEREERMKAQVKLEAENDKLKAENEAKAEILRKADSAADARAAQKFQELQDKRNAKSDEIQNATPEETNIGLCDDAKGAGVKFSFCE